MSDNNNTNYPGQIHTCAIEPLALLLLALRRGTRGSTRRCMQAGPPPCPQRARRLAMRLVLLLGIILSAGCAKESKAPEVDTDGKTAYLYLSVRAASTSINQDNLLWEDRVDELRMIIFSMEDGSVLYNRKLYFPDGFSARSRAVPFTPGTYDFCFIANETASTPAFVAALESMTNRSDFLSDARFLDIPYDPGFIPDATSPGGRFLMSALYDAIPVESGGTETNPLPLTLPTSKVELVRSMAKVQVVFRKSVAGSTIDDNAVSSVIMQNVASSLSVPPYDNYYSGGTTISNPASLEGFDYANDSIGSVTFYIPEFLAPENAASTTSLVINNQAFPIENDDARAGLAQQRRTIASLSGNSVIRNYHYLINAYINAEGGLKIKVFIEPWTLDNYIYIFQGDQQITIPPVIPTDSSIIIPTECGRVEVLSMNENLGQGLQGAYNDQIVYYDPNRPYPYINRGDPPYYCEKKYGEGWRLINSCELMTFLGYCDSAYNVWTSNTWEADTWGMQYYPLAFRQEAQSLLEKLTGLDLSGTTLYDTNNWLDDLDGHDKLNLIDDYFTPGDIMVREEDYPGGWPFPSPPGTSASEDWYYNEVTIQVKAYWYGAEYISPSIRENWDRILYNQFHRYDFACVSRCVRSVED